MNVRDITLKVGDVINGCNITDSFNIYISLFDIFKTSKFKKISGENFIVSDGIIQFKNYFIPLDAISMVEMGRLQVSFKPFLILLVFSCFISERSIFYELITRILLYLGFLGLIITVIVNIVLPYVMTIRLNNDIFCTYMSYKKSFIQEMVDKMQECINNRKGEYNFMLNQGKIIEYNDNHSINIGGGVGGDVIMTGAKKEIHENSDNVTKYPHYNSKITPEDWVNLEKFFLMRQQEFSAGDRNYKICNNLVTYSQMKDTGKIKKYLQTIGKEGLRMLFTASTNVAAMETVKPIIQKILSLKG